MIHLILVEYREFTEYLYDHNYQIIIYLTTIILKLCIHNLDRSNLILSYKGGISWKFYKYARVYFDYYLTCQHWET